MSGFTLYLHGAEHGERIDGVTSFVGEDASGSFGILAHHARFMTVLVFGLARFTLADGRREYLGLPGGVLYFVDNALHLSTRRYLRDSDARHIASALDGELSHEERELAETHRKLHRLEAEMLRHLVNLERSVPR